MSEQQMTPSKSAESLKEKTRGNALEKAAAEFADDATEKDETGARRKRDFSYTQNRELSWLRFDSRVLDEAFDETAPLRAPQVLRHLWLQPRRVVHDPHWRPVRPRLTQEPAA